MLTAMIPAHIRAPYDEANPDATMNGGGLPRFVPIYPPEIYPIPDAREFNVSGTASTSAIQSNVSITLSPQVGDTAGIVTLPRGNIGVLRSYQITIANMVATTNVTWSLFINNAPVAGYGGISIIPRAAPFVSNTFDLFVRVQEGSQISVVFSNNDGGVYTVGASFGGWYWPTSSGIRWMQTGV